ncbi:hypothetical protein Q9K02_10620 [Qipengyuania sp. G39]|uniref:Uncharacterized protein n=1 Tax=Qipengyuania profundimaris TaxID=3067652 RepID=A0ABT9HR06_9SPHN|nr:hypothetical protein [Qipengyuania sp. G39]MDP4575590.1 hypothetical protein [Qipengyuania sp. G39]
MPPDNDVTVITASTLQEWAENCIGRLRSYAETKPESDAAHRYAEALRSVRRVEIAELGDRAFNLEGDTLTLNATPLWRTFEVVFEDISDEDLQLDPGQIIPLCNMILAIFLLHELRHIDQRVERFEDVQVLKSLGFSPLVAELDLLADRDALIAFSALFRNDFEDGEMEAFETGLAFSPRYFFKAFDFDPAKKPHKTLRAVSLILMLARIYCAKNSPEKPIVSLDAALSFYGLEALNDMEDRPFVILAEQPSRRIYQIADADWSVALARIIASVEKRDYDGALALGMLIIENKEFPKSV